MTYTAKNLAVLERIDAGDHTILDVGCGTGANAETIKKRFPNCNISGISYSSEELELANKFLDNSFLINLDQITENFTNEFYDLIICSHVIEHLYNPKNVLNILASKLNTEGRIIVIVPNIAIWHSRLKLLSGKFEYEEHGLFDRTHIRFFTYNSLINEAVPESLRAEERFVTGHFPLPLVRKFLSRNIVEPMDNFALNYAPNLFASELGLILKNK